MYKYCLIVFLAFAVSCSDSNGESEQSQEKNQSSSSQPKPTFRVTHEYSTAEVEQLDSATLRIYRNEIFAQYGYVFKSPELTEFFLRKEWYKPEHKNVDTFLSELDKQNINVLLAQERKLEKIRNFDCDKIPFQLSSYVFNSSIQLVIDSLGVPDRSFVDEDKFCAVGQLHYWKNDEDEFELIVLGDSYSKEVDLKASSRLYVLQTTNKFEISKIEFAGIYLGDDSPDVEMKLRCLVKNDPQFSYTKATGTSAVERFLIIEQTHLYVLTNGKVWIHFSINPFDRLDFILFSDFNIRQAC